MREKRTRGPHDTPHLPPRVPSPPPFYLSTDLEGPDEVDVDLADDDHDHDQGGGDGDDHPDTIPEGVEYLGTYRSVADYLRAMLEPEIQPGVHWIFDTLDWDQVLARFEADGSRYFCERGHVFRTHLSLQPEPDPVGPWMPTRGV